MDNKEEYFKFLTIIQQRGNIDKFTACRYLADVYELPDQEALNVLVEWINKAPEE